MGCCSWLKTFIDMTKQLVGFCNFPKVPNILSTFRNGTPAVQLAALKIMRRLGGPHVQSVRGAELLTAHFVNLHRRSLLPKCYRVSLCRPLQDNDLYSFHSRQTHAPSIAICKVYLHQISWNSNKSLVVDTRCLTELRTDGRKWSVRKTFLLLYRNQSPNLAVGIRHKWTFIVSHCTRITSLHSLQQKRIFKKQLTTMQILNLLMPVSQHSLFFMLSIKLYFLHKRCKAISITPQKTCLISHPYTTQEGQISHWHRGGRLKSRMS